MINPVVGKSLASWRSERSDVAVDLSTCPLATLTKIEGDVGSVFFVGARGQCRCVLHRNLRLPFGAEGGYVGGDYYVVYQ